MTLERRDPLAVIWIDNPPVNALSASVRRGLSSLLQQVEADDRVRQIAFACRGRSFVSGADIKEFGITHNAPKVAEVVEQVGRTAKPTWCFLHGHALGGGLELALACDWRVAEPNTRLGLPEVKLGLIPGAGGTQRLPRLIGVSAALEMLLSGDSIPANEAYSIGLIDRIETNGCEPFLQDLMRQSKGVKRASTRMPISTDTSTPIGT